MKKFRWFWVAVAGGAYFAWLVRASMIGLPSDRVEMLRRAWHEVLGIGEQGWKLENGPIPITPYGLGRLLLPAHESTRADGSKEIRMEMWFKGRHPDGRLVRNRYQVIGRLDRAAPGTKPVLREVRVVDEGRVSFAREVWLWLLLWLPALGFGLCLFPILRQMPRPRRLQAALISAGVVLTVQGTITGRLFSSFAAVLIFLAVPFVVLLLVAVGSIWISRRNMKRAEGRT